MLSFQDMACNLDRARNGAPRDLQSMKNIKTIVIIMILAAAGFIAYGFYSAKKSSQSGNVSPGGEAAGEETIFEPKTDSQGGVTITIAPKTFSEENSTWDFEITFDTHSVELNQDLTKVAVLIDESGKEYKPSAWEGDPAGGHHRKGILKFNSIKTQPSSFVIKIKEVGGIAERVFSWQKIENTLNQSVSIKNFAFSPKNLTIKTGTTVIWINEDSAPHSIKSDNFNSEIFSKGESYQFRFNSAGVYNYICGVHPSMKGKIIVE